MAKRIRSYEPPPEAPAPKPPRLQSEPIQTEAPKKTPAKAASRSVPSALSRVLHFLGRILKACLSAFIGIIQDILNPELSLSRRIISLVLLGICCFSLVMILSITHRSQLTHRTYDEIAQLHASNDTVSVDNLQIFGASDDSTAPALPGEQGESIPPLETENTALEQVASSPVEMADLTDAYASEPDESDLVPEDTLEEDTTPQPFHRFGGEALASMSALYEKNHDLIAWLNIPGTLDLPVVYRDNTYYLTHDFYGQKNASGALFLDQSHPFREKTQNLLIHGHNMRDGTMFGRLTQFRSLPYVKSHAFMNFSSLWEEEKYVLFAVVEVSLDPKNPSFFNFFSYPQFHSDREFAAFIQALEQRSLFDIPVDIRPTDALLTLSTCLDDDRLVLVARKIRPGENESALRQIVQSASKS